MCFYDQYQMTCGDFKWGHFKQHCSKEYRTGETCGMKLVMNTIQKADKCKLCIKIDTKQGRVAREEDRIKRWLKEEQRGQQRRASIENSQNLVNELYHEINDLEIQRSRAQMGTR